MTTGTKLQYPMVLSSFSPHSLKNKKVDTEESNQYKTLITCSVNSDPPPPVVHVLILRTKQLPQQKGLGLQMKITRLTWKLEKFPGFSETGRKMPEKGK